MGNINWREILDGGVGSILALLFSGVAAYLFVIGQPVPNELLVITVYIVKDYFAERTNTVTREDLTPPEPFVERPG